MLAEAVSSTLFREEFAQRLFGGCAQLGGVDEGQQHHCLVQFAGAIQIEFDLRADGICDGGADGICDGGGEGERERRGRCGQEVG